MGGVIVLPGEIDYFTVYIRLRVDLTLKLHIYSAVKDMTQRDNSQSK